MLDIKDFDLKQLRTQAASQPTCELPKKVFVPFCRVKSGQEIFKNREYEWGELPEELYAKFCHKV